MVWKTNQLLCIVSKEDLPIIWLLRFFVPLHLQRWILQFVIKVVDGRDDLGYTIPYFRDIKSYI